MQETHPAVAFAQAQEGRPYCWGGAGPDCFDCSGLTHMAWHAAGRDIPRTSDDQHEQLRRIHWAFVLPGDVVWRPGHVGLYVGNGWAIHAPGDGKTVRYQRVDKYRLALRVY
jgi:cell wall-associated NlpC family hydrolase